MDNVNQSQRNGPPEYVPTQPQRFTPGGPGGPADPSYELPVQAQRHGQVPQGGQFEGGPWLTGPDPRLQPPGEPGQYALHGGQGPYGQNPPTQQLPPSHGFQPPRRPKRGWMRSRKARWGAGIAAAVVLGAGGALAGLELTGSAAPAPNAAQAVALNTAMGYKTGCSLSSVSASSGSAAIRADRASVRRCLRARLRIITGMYGEVAYHTKTGTQTLAFERGQITSSGNGQLSVQADDGTTWTWDEASSPILRENGRQASLGALQSGIRVFIGGFADGDSREARVIVIHAAQSSSGKKPANGKKPAKPSNSSSTST